MKILSFIALSLLVVLLFYGCKHEPLTLPVGSAVNQGGGTGGGGTNGGGGGTNNCDPGTVYFNQDILPFLVSNCAKSGCHDALSHKEGIILDSYANVMATADIQPYNVNGGDLYEVITTNDVDDIMPEPPNAPLTSQQINLIATWINQGAQNLTCTNNSCDSIVISYTTDVSPIINNKCKGCHTGANPGGGVTLNSYATVLTSAQNGKLMGSITHATGFQPMPKNGTMLSICEIGIIRNWIAEGAQNN